MGHFLWWISEGQDAKQIKKPIKNAFAAEISQYITYLWCRRGWVELFHIMAGHWLGSNALPVHIWIQHTLHMLAISRKQQIQIPVQSMYNMINFL